jgi:hypothetical protein
LCSHESCSPSIFVFWSFDCNLNSWFVIDRIQIWIYKQHSHIFSYPPPSLFMISNFNTSYCTFDVEETFKTWFIV